MAARSISPQNEMKSGWSKAWCGETHLSFFHSKPLSLTTPGVGMTGKDCHGPFCCPALWIDFYTV